MSLNGTEYRVTLSTLAARPRPRPAQDVLRADHELASWALTSVVAMCRPEISRVATSKNLPVAWPNSYGPEHENS